LFVHFAVVFVHRCDDNKNVAQKQSDESIGNTLVLDVDLLRSRLQATTAGQKSRRRNCIRRHRRYLGPIVLRDGAWPNRKRGL